MTLGIIGVVSAMTVPTLMQNYQRKSYVTQLHKVYNEISQAAMQFQTDRNAVNLREAGLNNSLENGYNFIKSYFKIVSDCEDSFTPCMAENYKKMNGTNISLSGVHNIHKCITIASGASICIYKGVGNILNQFAIDINGQNGPNIAGRDLFLMYIYNDGTVDDLRTTCNEDNSECGMWDGSENPPNQEEREDVFEKACKGSNTLFHGCFGKILNDNWEMTY